MPRVVPSQVVSFIDQVFPWAANQQEHHGVNLVMGNSAELTGLLNLIDEMPGELLTLDGLNYSIYVCSIAAVRNQIDVWTARGDVGALVFVHGLPQYSPVALIRRALVTCPDQSTPSATTALNFIADAELRANLRNDIGAIERALSNGEWKAATVLAGSAIEALLLWDLQNNRQAAFPAAVTALVANHTFQQPPSANPEEWSLHHYVEVEAHLGIIKQDTATEARLAKKFRNLIHPGRAQRLGQKYDRGTALSSVAALDHVVRDLTP
jgi:hypothetical protein